MGQTSLFSRSEVAAMRDRTASRKYSAAREEFRREHERHRHWGLQRRHAEKLRRLRESGVTRSVAAVQQVVPGGRGVPERGRRPGLATATPPLPSVAPARPPAAPAVRSVVPAVRSVVPAVLAAPAVSSVASAVRVAESLVAASSPARAAKCSLVMATVPTSPSGWAGESPAVNGLLSADPDPMRMVVVSARTSSPTRDMVVPPRDPRFKPALFQLRSARAGISMISGGLCRTVVNVELCDIPAVRESRAHSSVAAEMVSVSNLPSDLVQFRQVALANCRRNLVSPTVSCRSRFLAGARRIVTRALGGNLRAPPGGPVTIAFCRNAATGARVWRRASGGRWSGGGGCSAEGGGREAEGESGRRRAVVVRRREDGEGWGSTAVRSAMSAQR
jgi:hypothetical protein